MDSGYRPPVARGGGIRHPHPAGHRVTVATMRTFNVAALSAGKDGSSQLGGLTAGASVVSTCVVSPACSSTLRPCGSTAVSA